MPYFVPQPVKEVSQNDFPDATDLATAIQLVNKLKNYTLLDPTNIREQLNLLIQVVSEMSNRMEQ